MRDRSLKHQQELLDQFSIEKGEFPQQEQLILASLDQLKAWMTVPEFVQLGYDENVSDIEKLEPLIRFGKPILAHLRQRQAAEKDLSKKGNYEVIAAAITGKIDSKLMRLLLASDNPDRGLACQLVLAAGSHGWTNEIAQLQFRPGFERRQASETLASVLRKRALPYLRKALAFDPDNYVAKSGILELEKWRE